MLSRTAKESIKTALAVTLVYAIALAMDWDRPYWAALAVAVCSLGTLGDSLTKAAHRILGTALALAVSLLILSLTIQDRWWFMVLLSAWLAFCAYRLTGSRVGYAWQVGGFVTAIIAIDASGIPEQAFSTAVLRAQETTMGVVVYSLVSIFLWPARSGTQFRAIARERAATQRKLFQACRKLLSTGEGGDDVKQLRTQLLQQQGQFDRLLESASADTPEIGETIGQWRRYQREAAALSEALLRWQQGFAELRPLGLSRLAPGAEAFDDEIERRLVQVERMLDGQAPECAPQAVTLSLASDAMQSLKHFDVAALTVDRSTHGHIESSSRALFDRVADIEGFDRSAADEAAASPRAPQQQASSVPAFMLDPDRLWGAVRVLVAVWLAYLAYLFVPDLPAGTLVVSLTASVAMAVAGKPQVPMTLVVWPLLSSLVFAAAIHVLVMWRLETFLGLGLLLFTAVFGICYLFSDPRHMLNRAVGLPIFFVVVSIDNEQTYSFLRIADVGLGALLAVAVLFVSAYVPHQPLADRAFVRFSRRFFRSCAWLVSDAFAGPTHGETRLRRWKRAYHRREVATLPAKLPVWGMFIDTKALPGTTPAQVAAVASAVQVLMDRLQALLEARARAHALPLLSGELETWRRELERIFRRLSERPDAIDSDALRTALDGFLMRLEDRVREVIGVPDTSQVSPHEGEDFYRLLGAQRSVSEALVDYARAASAIDWEPWREARFA
jgi:uncharacterized membrane protein YccC